MGGRTCLSQVGNESYSSVPGAKKMKRKKKQHNSDAIRGDHSISLST